MTKCGKVCSVITMTSGLVMIVVGVVVLVWVFPSIMDDKIHQGLRLENGSISAERFQTPPVPIYLSFYFFNITNKNDVIQNISTVPILQQLGPYVYREEKIKEVSKWDTAMGTVIYKERTTYFFEPGKTKGDLSDSINHINAVSVTLKYFLQPFGDYLVERIRGDLIQTHTVDELIFTGYNIEENFPKILAPLCIVMNNCTFAFYQGKNGSLSQEYEVSSGVLSMKDYTEIKKYGMKEELVYWYGPTCNALNGTDGTQFPPGVTKDSQLFVFSSDICRSIIVKYQQEVSVEDIPALRFALPPAVFADPNKDKENMCFCHRDPTIQCPSKAGVIPLSTCQSGSPVMGSAPHFYLGEPEYYQKFQGLNPNKEEHQTFLDVEPLTGAVLNAAKRIQLSIKLEPDKRLRFLKDLKTLWYFPVLWVEEAGKVDKDNAEMFRKQVLTPYRAGKWSLVSVITVGGILLLALTLLFILKKSGFRVPYASLSEEDEVVSTENINERQRSNSS